jgi:hypothetical protein
MQLIICVDINVNYLAHNSRRKMLDALLSSFNLSSTVYFPTRLENKSATAIDNVFIDTCNFPNYVVSPLYNGLSDHDAQLFKLSDIDIKIQNPKFKIIRRIDTYYCQSLLLPTDAQENCFQGVLKFTLILK